MNAFSSSCACDADDDIALPCIEALLAATLALMTGYAEHAGTPSGGDTGRCDPAHQEMRHALAAKVTAQLFHLSEHPLLSPAFRGAIWQLRGHWQAVERRMATPAPTEPYGATVWTAASATRH